MRKPVDQIVERTVSPVDAPAPSEIVVHTTRCALLVCNSIRPVASKIGRCTSTNLVRTRKRTAGSKQDFGGRNRSRSALANWLDKLRVVPCAPTTDRLRLDSRPTGT
jgi:hypothetical protein